MNVEVDAEFVEAPLKSGDPTRPEAPAPPTSLQSRTNYNPLGSVCAVCLDQETMTHIAMSPWYSDTLFQLIGSVVIDCARSIFRSVSGNAHILQASGCPSGTLYKVSPRHHRHLGSPPLTIMFQFVMRDLVDGNAKSVWVRLG